ncbi:MAG: dephospho-CoA kinase [Erysipelotrichaceae bacterium]|nr:dephospho-CoA kinase [Erysipelotrichaceae bacterium]
MPEVSEMRIAITGTMGSGKSTVSALLMLEGCVVLECDKINAELLEDPYNQHIIVKNLQLEKFDKKEISKVIFDDAEKKSWLEGFLHPQILEAIYKVTNEVVFVEVPLLFEAGWQKYFDKTIVVTCDEEVALERLQKYRGFTKEEAMKRIRTQMPKEEKIRLADYEIPNNAGIQQLHETVRLFLKETGFNCEK